jgi:hypothetical protein
MDRKPERIPYLASLATAAALSGCAGEAVYGGPDMEPVGSGLRFIGIGLVVMALVFVLSRR